MPIIFGWLHNFGFRDGSEIVIALTLGLNGVLQVFSYKFGFTPRGQVSIEHAINILAKKISITLKLKGISIIDELRSLGDSCAHCKASLV